MDIMDIDTRSPSIFEDLPVEIVEQITLYAGHSSLSNVINLRSTSRTMQAKTRHAFIQVAFRTIRLNMSRKKLCRLQNISRSPEFGQAVHGLLFIRDEVSTELQDAAKDDRDAHYRLEEAINEQMWMESSGIETTMLTVALFNLPNIKQVQILPVELEMSNVRRQDYMSSCGPGSTTAFASSVLAAIAHSSTYLESLTVGSSNSMGFRRFQGLSTNAFYFPEDYFSCFANLRELRLAVSRDNSIMYSSRSSLCGFLRRLPSLSVLVIVLDTFLYDRPVFDDYLICVPASRLHHFSLEGTFFAHYPGDGFLSAHMDTLTFLEIKNCNLQCREDPSDNDDDDNDEEDRGWTRILRHLKAFKSLRRLRLYQLAEMDFRTYYPTQGLIEHIELPESLDFDKEGWGLLSKPQRYHVLVEEWEDMATRLEEIRADFKIAEDDFRSDDATLFAEHVWYE